MRPLRRQVLRYFSLPIETPHAWDDYDAIRWYLAHGQTLVYVEKETWFLVVMTRCQFLTAEDRCGIYHSRPKICRGLHHEGMRIRRRLGLR